MQLLWENWNLLAKSECAKKCKYPVYIFGNHIFNYFIECWKWDTSTWRFNAYTFSLSSRVSKTLFSFLDSGLFGCEPPVTNSEPACSAMLSLSREGEISVTYFSDPKFIPPFLALLRDILLTNGFINSKIYCSDVWNTNKVTAFPKQAGNDCQTQARQTRFWREVKSRADRA